MKKSASETYYREIIVTNEADIQLTKGSGLEYL